MAKQKISISAIDGAKRFLYLIRLLEGKKLEMMIIKKSTPRRLDICLKAIDQLK